MIGTPQLHQRASGTYRVDGMNLADTRVRLTFPASFDVEAMRGVTVDATVFAERPDSTHPLWCDFKHPGDGHWRSVFAQRAWIEASTEPATPAEPAIKRGPFKRPPR
jgi:hypothetical protein